MSNVLNRMTAALYRFGLHHEDGATSMVSIAAHPVRLTVGELSASTADVIVKARRGRSGLERGRRSGGDPSP